MPFYEDKNYKDVLKEQRFPTSPRRDGQVSPVMIPSGSTLNQVVDVTFATDSDLALNAAQDALKATIVSQTALSASLAENLDLKATIASLTSLSASFEARLTALEP
jgi:hypothetical protein